MKSPPRSVVVDQLTRNCLRRTRMASLVFAAMFGLNEVLALAGGQSDKLPLYANLSGLAASLLTLYLLGSARLGMRSKVGLSFIFLLAISLSISLGELTNRWLEGQGGLSRLTLVVVLIPVLLPLDTRGTIRFGLVLISTQALAYLVLSLAGFPAWSFEQTVFAFGSDLLAVATAALPALVVADLNVRALGSYEMGNYRLVELMATGGMGQVWLADHKFLPTQAAVKMIILPDDQDQQSPDSRRGFHREAEALANLKSPYTVRVLDFGEDALGRLYIAMELLRGLDLDKLVRQHGPVPSGRVIKMLDQACLSLHEAHQLGMTHGDIKPANLFLTHIIGMGDCLKVLDFGLVQLQVKSSSSVEGATEIAGTPEFMAPEVARAESVSPRSDLYSLGCVAFWLLTGQHVFGTRTYMESFMAHQSDTPPRPSWRTERPIPAELDRLIESCLHKDPNRRPQSAAEMRVILAAIPSPEDWVGRDEVQWWEQQALG
ncbi:MAG: serine/threonine-protein kinase [Vulcanimicrobiota bacterium]